MGAIHDTSDHISNLSPPRTNLQRTLFPDSSHNTFAAVAHHIWGSTPRAHELLPDFSSISSSASTVTSFTTCIYSTQSAVASIGLARSFDFKRLGMQLTPLTDYLAYTHDDLATSSDPSPLRCLSVGSGYAWGATGRWQEPTAAKSEEELEEYSLGSGNPG